jgi:hypothetical protein
MIADGKLDAVDDLEAAAIKLRALIDRVKTAPYGYAGFFDAVTIKSDELEMLYQHDLLLLEGVDELSRAIDNVDASVGTEGEQASIRHLTTVSQELIDTYNKRDEAILATGSQVQG